MVLCLLPDGDSPKSSRGFRRGTCTTHAAILGEYPFVKVMHSMFFALLTHFLKGREATGEVLYESEDEVFAIETTSHAINSETFVNIW